MTPEAIEEWTAHTLMMLHSPKQGDHFTEHFGSVCLVEHRIGGVVAVRFPDQAKKEWGPPVVMRVRELRERLTYKTGSVQGKPWVEGWRKGLCPRAIQSGGNGQ